MCGSELFIFQQLLSCSKDGGKCRVIRTQKEALKAGVNNGLDNVFLLFDSDDLTIIINFVSPISGAPAF